MKPERTTEPPSKKLCSRVGGRFGDHHRGRTSDGESAFYAVATTSPSKVRGYLTPNLDRARIPFSDGTTFEDVP